MARENEARSQRELIAMKHIMDAVRSTRYGTITLIVQDGLVIQIDRTEKTRLNYELEISHSNGEGI